MFKFLYVYAIRLYNRRIQAVRVATRYPLPLSSHVDAPAPRAPPSRQLVIFLGNVGLVAVSHAQYVLTVTAARVKAAVSKAVW